MLSTNPSARFEELVSALRKLDPSINEGAPSETEFPRSKWQAISDAGFFEAAVDQAFSLNDRLKGMLTLCETLGEVSQDSGLNFTVATHLASTISALEQFGSEDLKARYLADLSAGRLIGAHAISEPGAGSDAVSMQATAAKHGDEYVLNGHKAFVTNGPIADVIVVYAKTSDSKAGGISAFLVPTTTKGVKIGPTMKKVGLISSPLSELTLDDCRIPAANLIGREGAGFLILSYVMKREILYSFMMNVGEMKRRIDRCVRYANTREQFGTSIGAFQSVANKIVEMKMRYEMSRNWILHVAEKVSQNKDVTTDVAIAKVYVSESALSTAIDAVHVFGGYGFLAENGLGAEVCNALAGPIYSGTNDIQRSRIAAMMGIRA
ncbi:acyl-CoA dehydrogenase family protein [Pseudovibrio exalbescens]|uniref:acyl-CoA dehydrogenase family protein n=1 Tax=Pseudovibrio exalbescens TaxID=197461 RepID=UPI0023671394|nr:acyl-CoA dehydrogenase family protein [Pseudovibrio exalbescens]MDD7910803.1 acyl-CoA dehydrogenase family protein [Pseudovibrio exalbescens]